MRVSRGKAAVISDLTIDEDLDFLTLYQAKRLASPASGEALRKGNKDITNAEIADAAAITISKLVNTYLLPTILTTEGDIVVRGASNPTRLAKITTGQYLKATSTGYEGGTVTVKYYPLELVDFQANSAIGTMNAPQYINDNNTGNPSYGDAIGEYAIVDFKQLVKMTQYRQYGDGTQNGDGAFRLDYMDEDGVWQEWVATFATRPTGNWSNWVSVGEVIAQKLRLWTLAVDTGVTKSYMRELEVKY